jgi:hypothetical protein
MARRNRTEPQPSPEPAQQPAPAPTVVADRRRPLLLAVAALLFVGWIGWLAYLVTTARPPVVLSQPQMLAATLDVIAQVDDLEKPVKVVEVLWPEDSPNRGAWVGKELTLSNLSYCTADWAGPGEYLLPLRKAEQGDNWVVAPTAPNPGYPAPDDKGRKRVGPPRIYPNTPSVRAQHAQLRR